MVSKMIVLLYLLVVLAAAAPPTSKVTITKDFFPPSTEIYAGRFEIVDVHIIKNTLNNDIEHNVDESIASRLNAMVNYYILFVVEGDVKENGIIDYKGLYVVKDGEVEKLLDNGQCTTSMGDKVYFGAKDGIYKYNNVENTAEKYGTVNDNVIKIAMDVKNKKVHYLTEDFVLYKFGTDEVTTTKVEAVKDARDIVFDKKGYLYFYDGSKQFYVYDGEQVKKIEGLPPHPTKVKLIQSPLETDAFAIIDGSLYKLTEAAIGQKTFLDFQAMPTAFTNDDDLNEYYAHDRKVFRVHLPSLTKETAFGGFQDLMVNKSEK